MQVYDFTTLYTNLNLDVVRESLNSLIDLTFSEKNKYICISYDRAFFAKKKYNGYYTFDAKSIKDAIEFLLDNTYIKFAEFILIQKLGIPMGGSCSSPMADLTLAYSEYLYMKKIIKKKFGLAKLLSNNSRYIDDINIINYKRFSKIINEIYPTDLKVERSGDNDKIINYLDVTITIIVCFKISCTSHICAFSEVNFQYFLILFFLFESHIRALARNLEKKSFELKKLRKK